MFDFLDWFHNEAEIPSNLDTNASQIDDSQALNPEPTSNLTFDELRNNYREAVDEVAKRQVEVDQCLDDCDFSESGMKYGNPDNAIGWMLLNNRHVGKLNHARNELEAAQNHLRTAAAELWNNSALGEAPTPSVWEEFRKSRQEEISSTNGDAPDPASVDLHKSAPLTLGETQTDDSDTYEVKPVFKDVSPDVSVETSSVWEKFRIMCQEEKTSSNFGTSNRPSVSKEESPLLDVTQAGNSENNDDLSFKGTGVTQSQLDQAKSEVRRTRYNKEMRWSNVEQNKQLLEQYATDDNFYRYKNTLDTSIKWAQDADYEYKMAVERLEKLEAAFKKS